MTQGASWCAAATAHIITAIRIGDAVHVGGFRARQVVEWRSFPHACRQPPLELPCKTWASGKTLLEKSGAIFCFPLYRASGKTVKTTQKKSRFSLQIQPPKDV